jgi:hypothetical protein
MTEELDKQPQSDILEDVKKYEKALKVRCIVKSMEQIKKMAHEVLELKDKSISLFKEFGLADEDIKRLIDFVNSLSDVKLSEDDHKGTKEWAKKEANSLRKEIEKVSSNKIIEKVVHSFNTEGLGGQHTVDYNNYSVWSDNKTYTTDLNANGIVTLSDVGAPTSSVKFEV